MTETYRRSGDETPQYQGYAHGPQAPGGTSGTGYPAPPPHPPYAAPQPAAGSPAGPGTPGPGTPGPESPGPGNPGFGGPGGPGGPDGPEGTGAPAPRRRARRPVALIAAVALASGLIGGGSAALIGSATDQQQAATTTPAVNTGTAKGGGSVSAVAKAVTPAIVEIKARTQSGESTGSGVVVTPDGEIVTNNHVVAGASSIEVTFSDGTKKQADIVGTDPDKDLALIKVKGAKNLTTASFGNSDQLAVGDEVVAIGSPEGLTGSVTSGIVSALKRDVTVPKDEGRQQQEQGGPGWPFEFGGNQYNGDTGQSKTTYKAIQTDAALNPGNSGGALIDMKGRVIGINSAMYSPSSAQGSSSAGSVGLGFAIPINTVKADLANLRSGGSSKS
ncbi:trypsin-like peptidase domain-containing protein [Streptomyces sp. NPDC052496]|uniref:S1C family serine protease n=1 Tax=Streptomyces sp. NPDC052496 TaxID=3154951 RepID=UPI003424B0BC